MRLYLASLALIAAAMPVTAAKKNLEMFFVDVEGGQATLIVSPSGESLLVDTGWPGFGGRDADRIVAAAKKAKLKKIDYVVITHHHRDHVGGVLALTERIPVGTFIDHGPNTETGKGPTELNGVYEKARAGSKYVTAKPGDRIPVKGLDIQVVQSNGDRITTALKGGGQPNPSCGSAEKKEADPTENARSVGFILTFNTFRFVNLGDLTWNKELELVCPNNLLGNANVYLSTHHGMDTSNPPQMLAALQPKVVIMNNGAKKAGSPSTWRIYRAAPSVEDIWQLHFAIAGGKETNSPDTFIANLDESCEGKALQMTVAPDGQYTIENTRNKYVKTYR
jgi:beta-lactamase superfamily II metal-dependent hydrolase